jgi:hypothetical protein
MANEFMRRSKETGFGKFTDIGRNAWNIINSVTAVSSREDLKCYFLSHSENDANGKSKCKTIGKMLDEKITLEGMFTVVLHSLVHNKSYKFLTQNDGVHIAKSPLGMFDSELIDNDLNYINEQINKYYGE